MSVYVIDAHESSLADLPLLDLAAPAADRAPLEPAAEPPRLEIVLDEAADVALGNADEADDAESLDSILPAEDVVAMPHEELALRVAALEATAIAKLDALIKELQVNQPRRGRHAAEEITFSIRSFLGGRGARHLAEAAAA